MVEVKKRNIRTRLVGLLFLTFCSFAWIPAKGQTSYRIVGKSLFELKREQTKVLPIRLLNKLQLSSTISTTRSLDMLESPSIPYRMPSVYKYQDLAFFCRLEVKMEKAAKLPVRFRLGSVDYVDRLEGKY